MMILPENPQMIDDAWLSAALGRDVLGAKLTRIGEDEGFTGGGVFRVTFQGGSVVAKLSPDDPGLRATFANANAREVAFYKMAAAQSVPVPSCSFGAFEAETGTSALLTEDMGAARQVGFTTGCTEQDAGLAVDALAQIHGTFWQSAALDRLGDIDLLMDHDFAAAWQEYPAHLADLLPDVPLPQGFLDFGTYLAENLHLVFKQLWATGPLTCLHRDAQVDNVLFNHDGAIWLDWQFAGKGQGVCDVSFFMASSLEPETRRACEHRLIAQYYQKLLEHGVADYPKEHLLRDYAVSIAGRVFVTVVATILLDNTSPHRRAWRRTDLTRLLAFFKDHQLAANSLSNWQKNRSPLTPSKNTSGF